MVIMHSFFLKFKVVFTVLLINSVCAVAQNARFIYLQTENREEFYVKLDKKILNASPTGYLIIPRLSEQVYALTIGFYHGGPEISTSIKIRETNLGLLLKNTADKGWIMMNLQTMQPVAIKKEFPPGKQETVNPNVDEFTRILAEVVDEPSIAWAPVITTDQIVVAQQVNKTETKTLQSLKIDSAPEKKPVVQSDKTIKAKTKIAKSPKIDSTREIKPAMPVVINSKIETKIPKSPKIDSAREEKLVVPAVNPITNTNCKRTATQKDYLKLRRQMAGEANEKNMIKAANKQFLITCYSTEQIKNLSILFINEEEKYKFFVAAYPYVADTNNFGSLQDQLTDNYYKTRLNAMIRN